MKQPRKQDAPARVGQLVAYGLWGLVAFAVGMLALWVTFDIAGLPYALSVALSVTANLCAHYIASRTFVFTDTARSFEEGFVIFVGIGIAEIIGITALATLAVAYGGADEYVARIAAGILAACIGFWANGRFTFRAL